MKSQEISVQESGNQVLLHYQGRCHSFRKSRGWVYLLELIRHPGKEYYPQQLIGAQLSVAEEYRILSELGNSYLEQLGLNYVDTRVGIPMCDGRTLKELTRRMNQVLAIEAELRINNDFAALDDLLEEKEILEKYLCEVLHKSGRIRNFRTETDKAAITVNKALRRCIDGIEKVDPELGKIFRKRVRAWKKVEFMNYDL